jgi:hypothetical protein
LEGVDARTVRAWVAEAFGSEFASLPLRRWSSALAAMEADAMIAAVDERGERFSLDASEGSLGRVLPFAICP